MKFIVDRDWDLQIRQQVLSVVKGSAAALSDSIDAAISEASSYLRAKYDTRKIFAPVITWDADTSYPKDTRILFTAPPFSTTASYSTGVIASYQGVIYMANTNMTAGAWNASKWNAMCDDQSLFYVIANNTTAGFLPTNTDEYAPGDTRYPILLVYVKDLALYHLFSSISPQNTPTLRRERSEAATKWLTKVSKDELDADLPLLDVEKPSNTFRLSSTDDKYFQRW